MQLMMDDVTEALNRVGLRWKPGSPVLLATKNYNEYNTQIYTDIHNSPEFIPLVDQTNILGEMIRLQRQHYRHTTPQTNPSRQSILENLPPTQKRRYKHHIQNQSLVKLGGHKCNIRRGKLEYHQNNTRTNENLGTCTPAQNNKVQILRQQT